MKPISVAILMPAAPQGLSGAARTDRPGKPSLALEQAAKDFEAVLLQKLTEQMKRTIPSSGLLDSGVTEQVHDLFWLLLSQDLADKGGLGLWKDLHKRFAETASAAAPTVEAAP